MAVIRNFKERHLAKRSLDMMEQFGVVSIRIGNKIYKKKGKDIIEETQKKKKKNAKS